MKIDYCLILSAGLGTRMGVIGEHLPKCLWPIFEKTLLDLQIAYAKDLNISEENIYINSHHQSVMIGEFLKSQYKVTELYEEQLLDIGGAIHNLAKRVSYEGNVLILNSDVLYFCLPNLFANSIHSFEPGFHYLFSMNTQKNLGYNKINCDQNNFFTGITKAQLVDEENYLTYSGMSLIDLNLLEPVLGGSKFFESVVLAKNKQSKVIKDLKYLYYDFGTIDRYVKTLYRLTEEKNIFTNWLCDKGFIDQKFLNSSLKSYRSFKKNCLNFDHNNKNEYEDSIIISGHTIPTIAKNNSICYENLSCPIGSQLQSS